MSMHHLSWLSVRKLVILTIAASGIVGFATVSGCNDQAGSATGNGSADVTPVTTQPSAPSSQERPVHSASDLDLLWPPVRARPTTLEFGDVLLNEPITKTITLVNSGDRDAPLIEARTNCGCTTADVTGLVVPANGSLELPVHFDAEGKIGDRHATVTLLFSGWPNPITFNIRAFVITE